MSTTIRCRHCKTLLNTPLGVAKVRCPQCDTIISVNQLGTQSPTDAAPLSRSHPQPPASRPTWFYWLVGFVVAAGCVAFLGLITAVVMIRQSFSAPTRNVAINPPAPLTDRSPIHPSFQRSPITGTASTPPAAAASRSPQRSQTFRPLPPPFKVFPSGVRLHAVTINDPGAIGKMTSMQIYIPPGEHASGSLPCVCVAPAGTPLFYGAEVGMDNDYHDETLPYAEAGFVTIFYSLSGNVPEDIDDDRHTMALVSAYPKFRDAGGGVLNAKMAIDYAIGALPMVDSSRIATAGHSSAANVAMLTAMRDPRVQCCVAYAAAYDLSDRISQMQSSSAMMQLFPGIIPFMHQTSPIEQVAMLQCPTMIFHADDDSNVPIYQAERFVSVLKQTNSKVHYVTAPRGNHYQSMIDRGIPAAITWLKTADSNRH